MDAHLDVEDAPVRRRHPGVLHLRRAARRRRCGAAGAEYRMAVVLTPLQLAALEGKAGPHETLAPLEAALTARAVGRASPQVRARSGPSSVGQDGAAESRSSGERWDEEWASEKRGLVFCLT